MDVGLGRRRLRHRHGVQAAAGGHQGTHRRLVGELRELHTQPAGLDDLLLLVRLLLHGRPGCGRHRCTLGVARQHHRYHLLGRGRRRLPALVQLRGASLEIGQLGRGALGRGGGCRRHHRARGRRARLKEAGGRQGGFRWLRRDAVGGTEGGLVACLATFAGADRGEPLRRQRAGGGAANRRLEHCRGEAIRRLLRRLNSGQQPQPDFLTSTAASPWCLPECFDALVA
mmetsp:Transcript_22564/g.77172  ORF Transcript_22564/g.77172 Transcript_22564/m.77172 type:complete len:228 (-) Transcript_22564:47-730(-)